MVVVLGDLYDDHTLIEDNPPASIAFDKSLA